MGKQQPTIFFAVLVLPFPTLAQSFVTVDVPGSSATEIHGINDAGTIVGTFTDNLGVHGFLQTMAGLTTIDGPGATFTQANAINNLGQIVGTYGNDAVLHGFLQIGTALTTIDIPGSTGTVPFAINDSGQIVGGYYVGTNFNGFLWSGGSITAVNVPGATNTVAHGINDAGQVVGFYTDSVGHYHGFLWTAGVYTPIDIGSAGTEAHDINSSGEIVGSDGNDGFLLNGVNTQTINAPGASITNPYSINSTGKIAGTYIDIHGTHGFLKGGCAVDLTSSIPTVLENTPPWGSLTYDNSHSTVGALGCALTSLSTALKFAGVLNIGTVRNTPGTLNTFMQSNSLFSGHQVIWDSTVALLNPALRFDPYQGYVSSITNAGAAFATIDHFLCSSQPAPVIVGVRSTIHDLTAPFPGHFVLVTGRRINADGTVSYLIADPAGAATTLDDFVYTNVDGTPEFETRGAIQPSP